jgi:hypothetical protein
VALPGGNTHDKRGAGFAAGVLPRSTAVAPASLLTRSRSEWRASPWRAILLLEKRRYHEGRPPLAGTADGSCHGIDRGRNSGASLPPRHMDPGCITVIDDTDVCVVVRNDGTVFGWLNSEAGYFENAAIYVAQCRPNIIACGTIASNRDIDGQLNDLTTSAKYAQLGHVYRACATLTDEYGGRHVDVCGPWRSWP